jgi:hypothetical protein
MSTRLTAIAIADTIVATAGGDAASAYRNACSARNIDLWWNMAARAAGYPESAATHEMRTHVIAVLHGRVATPDPFKGFPQ